MKGLSRYRDWWVPEGEIERHVTRRIRSGKQIDEVTQFCRHKRVAVQAGGNWGYWPAKMAGIFGTVYTFEPEHTNFTALAANLAGMPNVIRIEAALGAGAGPVGILKFPGKSGHSRVDGEGYVPRLRLDDLVLPVCDLIYLDIEGYEYPAIVGAQSTIKRCRPVIAFEEKGHSERMGYDVGSSEAYLKVLGYRVVKKVAHDLVMVPC